MKNKMLTIALLLSTGIALPADDGGSAKLRKKPNITRTNAEMLTKPREAIEGDVRYESGPADSYEQFTYENGEWIRTGGWHGLQLRPTPITGSPSVIISDRTQYEFVIMKLKRLDQEKLLDFLQERFDALSLTIKEMEDFKGKKAQTSAEYKLFKKQLKDQVKDQDIYKQLISELKDLLKEYSDFFTRNGALLYYLIGSKRVTVPVEDRQNEGSKLYHPIHMGSRMILNDSQKKELKEAEATGNIQVEEELGVFDRAKTIINHSQF